MYHAAVIYGQGEKSYLYIRAIPENFHYACVDKLNLCSMPLSDDMIKEIKCFILQVDTLSHEEMRYIKKMNIYGTDKKNYTYAGLILEMTDFNILDSIKIKQIIIGDKENTKVKSDKCISPYSRYMISNNNCLSDEMAQEINKDYSKYPDNRPIWFGGIVILDLRDHSEKVLSFGFTVKKT